MEPLKKPKAVEITTISQALLEAQKKIKNAEKSSVNPHFKNRYSTLKDVWDACHEALSDNGLSVTQTLGYDGDRVYLQTTLMHTSGETIESRCPLLLQRQDMQGLGSCVTYARRYSLAAIVGVTQDDDDGETAGRDDGTPRMITEAQVKRLYAISKATSMSNEEAKAILKMYGYESADSIQMKDYEKIVTKIQEFKK